MATLYVTEYHKLAIDSNGTAVLVGQEPSRTTTASIGGASAATPLKSSTRFVRLHCDAICCVRFDGAAATTSDIRMAANQTEFFGVGPGTPSVDVIASS